MIKAFRKAVSRVLAAQQIITDELLLYAYSTDASMYRMVPQLILMINNEPEVTAIIKFAVKYNVKLTFRAAGTSLNGQATTDQVLVVLSNSSWQKYTIQANGNQITLEPGIIGADANKYLATYRRQIGPDPASINSAKIGGIIANNSSGMCCGTSKNSYATLVNMRAILANGSVLDSSNPNIMSTFKIQNHKFISAIDNMRQQIVADTDLSTFIRKKFAIKNTSGYSLNAFLDHSDPIKIIERLLIGSEGTLGFVSEVTLATVPDYEFKALNLIHGNLDDLIHLTIQIANFGIAAIELLDYFSLQSIAHLQDLKQFLIEPPDENTAAIMIEIAETNQDQLKHKIDKIIAVSKGITILHQTGFVEDNKIRQTLWKARKGIYPSIAGRRPLGSSILIEDVAVEIDKLPHLITDLREMFNQFGYTNAAILGHVLAGNIHFIVTPDFSIAKELENYNNFMHAFTRLVANKYNGSLKAEHGSGRNISPFALVEWGQQCLDIMWQIKELFDPQNIFNPDVKLTRDNTLHTKHLKHYHSVNPEIDKCMECGFCEQVCPSRKLSLTPRQRNTVARKISTLTGTQKSHWQQSYQYYGIDTCATTGMCQTVCPVGINTGAFILSQKPQHSLSINHAENLAKTKFKVQLGNSVASIIGRSNLQNITQAAHNKFKSIPIYLNNMPKVQSQQFISSNSLSITNSASSSINNQPNVILIPACPNRVFASTTEYVKYPSQLILEKMGYNVTYPDNVADTCCGQMYHSQCNLTQQQVVQQDLLKDIKSQSVTIIDNSSCSKFAQDDKIALVDINEFIVSNLNRDQLIKKYAKIALHIDCSTAKHGFNPEYLVLLNLCANQVIIPEGIACCGFAGDKGFTTPELNANSLSHLAPQVAECTIGVTFNRSCQIGLSHHSGLQYISFVELILDCLTR